MIKKLNARWAMEEEIYYQYTEEARKEILQNLIYCRKAYKNTPGYNWYEAGFIGMGDDDIHQWLRKYYRKNVTINVMANLYTFNKILEKAIDHILFAENVTSVCH